MISKETDKVLEEIKSDKIKTLNLDDSFKFECQNCGTCCTNMTDIYLYPNDICDLRYILKEERLLRTYELHDFGFFKIELDKRTGLPLASVKFNQRYKGDKKIWLCSFLSKVKELSRNEVCFCGSGKKYKKCCLNKKSPAKFYCTIWNYRPVTCRIFPVGRLNVWNNEDGYYDASYYISEKCMGSESNKDNILKDWLEEKNLNIKINFCDDFINLINKIHKVKIYEYNNSEKYISDIANIFFNFDAYFNLNESNISIGYEELWKKIEVEIEQIILKIQAEGIKNGTQQERSSK